MHNPFLSMLMGLTLSLSACSLYQSPDRKRLAEQGQSALLASTAIRVSCQISHSTNTSFAEENVEVYPGPNSLSLVVHLAITTPTYSVTCDAQYSDSNTLQLRWADDHQAIKKYIEASLTYGQPELEFILN